MIRLTCTIAAILIAATTAFAEQKGKGTRTDSRVRTFSYHQDEVYRIDAYTGYVVSVQFAQGESVIDYEFGDSSSWLFHPNTMRDGVTFKPKLVPPQSTNMMIRTDRRIYNFVITGRRGGSPQNVGFHYRFSYPGESNRRAAQPDSNIFTAFSKARNRNIGYSAAGDEALRPEQAFDDGRKTYIRLRHQGLRPAIFAVGPNGRERLVNTTDLADGTIVVSGTYAQLVLRAGDRETCLFNDRLHKIENARIRKTGTRG